MALMMDGGGGDGDHLKAVTDYFGQDGFRVIILIPPPLYIFHF